MQIDFKNCTLVIKDGTGTPLTITAKLGEGTLTWTRRTPRKYILNHGLVGAGTVRNDDEQPMEVSLTALYDWLVKQGSEDVSIYEALHQEGGASAWVTTGSDPCEPYCCTLEFTHTPPCASVYKEVITFPYFRVEEASPDPKGGMIQFRGKCKATKPTITRVVNS